jgi:hypothetical protein
LFVMQAISQAPASPPSAIPELELPLPLELVVPELEVDPLELDPLDVVEPELVDEWVLVVVEPPVPVPVEPPELQARRMAGAATNATSLNDVRRLACMRRILSTREVTREEVTSDILGERRRPVIFSWGGAAVHGAPSPEPRGRNVGPGGRVRRRASIEPTGRSVVRAAQPTRHEGVVLLGAA